MLSIQFMSGSLCHTAHVAQAIHASACGVGKARGTARLARHEEQRACCMTPQPRTSSHSPRKKISSSNDGSVKGKCASTARQRYDVKRSLQASHNWTASLSQEFSAILRDTKSGPL